MNGPGKQTHSYLNGTLSQLEEMVQDIADEVSRLKANPESYLLKSRFETDSQYAKRIKLEKKRSH